MRILVVVLAFLLFPSCRENKKEEETSKMDEVMIIHDEVMPKMGHLSKLVGELKNKIDTTERGKQYEAAMKDLQASNKAMMDWMMGFGNRFDSDEILNGKALSPQKEEWLNEEEEKVKALKEQINTSIAKAEKLLGK